MCSFKIHVTDSKYLEKLPSNLYINSLLELVGKREASQIENTPTISSSDLMSVDLHAASIRCSQCQTICDASATTCCDHCKLVSVI